MQRLLRLRKQYGDERLEAACARAQHYGDGHFRRVKQILVGGLDMQPLDPPPAAPVVPAAFAREIKEFFGEAVKSC